MAGRNSRLSGGLLPAFEGFAVPAGDPGHFGQRYAFADELQRRLSFIGAFRFVGYDFMLLHDASYRLATGFRFLGRGFDVLALVIDFEDLINKSLHDVGVFFGCWFAQLAVRPVGVRWVSWVGDVFPGNVDRDGEVVAFGADMYRGVAFKMRHLGPFWLP